MSNDNNEKKFIVLVLIALIPALSIYFLQFKDSNHADTVTTKAKLERTHSELKEIKTDLKHLSAAVSDIKAESAATRAQVRQFEAMTGRQYHDLSRSFDRLAGTIIDNHK